MLDQYHDLLTHFDEVDERDGDLLLTRWPNRSLTVVLLLIALCLLAPGFLLIESAYSGNDHPKVVAIFAIGFLLGGTAAAYLGFAYSVSTTVTRIGVAGLSRSSRPLPIFFDFAFTDLSHFQVIAGSVPRDGAGDIRRPSGFDVVAIAKSGNSSSIASYSTREHADDMKALLERYTKLAADQR